MKKTVLSAAALLWAVTATVAAEPQTRQAADQTITTSGSVPSAAGPADYFTGRVRVDMLTPASDNINAYSAYVTFEPGARSAWH
jgi:hypothetical protein